MRIRKVDIRCPHCGTINHKQQVLSDSSNVKYRTLLLARQSDVFFCRKCKKPISDKENKEMKVEWKGRGGLFISIMGDSISTYDGYNPWGYAVYYKNDVLYDNEMTSVEDTWWKQVINAIKGNLCVNNSYSGSLVSGKYAPAGCSEERCQALHEVEKPNVILIYIGANDLGWKVSIGLDEPDNTEKFYGAYRTMLQKVKKNYPETKIVCGTLLDAYLRGAEKRPVNESLLKETAEYNQAIRQAVQEEGALLADVSTFGRRYQTRDFLHPDKTGHRQIAKLWLKCLEEMEF